MRPSSGWMRLAQSCTTTKTTQRGYTELRDLLCDVPGEERRINSPTKDFLEFLPCNVSALRAVARRPHYLAVENVD